MAIAIIKYGFLFTVFMVSLNDVYSQFLTRLVGVDDITSHLENLTEVFTTTSRILPHISSLLKSQENLQNLTNLILQNSTKTCSMAEMVDIQQQDLLQDVLRDQQANNNATTDLIAGMTASLDQLVETQSEMLVTQSRMGDALDRIADAVTEVVHLLQRQSPYIQNSTPTMTDGVGQQRTQNPSTSMQPTSLPRDCSDLASRGVHSSGTYTIQPEDDFGQINVYCDMDSNNEGWTVFQRRYDGSVDFYLDWDAYEDGFGTPDAEHWLGLRHIRRLTRQGSWTLRVDLEDFQNNTAYADYISFSVGDAASFYRLSIGAYSGTAGDSLRYHDNMPFSTKDSDNDPHDSAHCAELLRGAWWYNSCAHSNLNGLYLGRKRIFWRNPKKREKLERAKMKMRRVR